jgi:hypothetical protein
VFAARSAIFNLANGRLAWPGVCDGPRRRLSSPSHNAGPRTARRPSPVAAGYPRLLPHVTANLEPYAHTAVARMIDQANGSDDGPHRRLASIASKSAGRVSTGCRLTPDRVPVLARHNGKMAEEIEDVRLEDFLPRRALTGRPEFPS